MIGPGASNRRPRPSCKLVPPCKQGDHGPYINSKGENAVRPIGKYYFSEDALKHDLAGLKREDIYGWGEFYKRAKAWYKGEVDRLLHLEKVREELKKSPATIITTNPTSKPAEPISKALETNTGSQTPTTQRNDAASPPAKPPTRIQPARAAKRKAADPPPTKPPPRRKPKAQAPAFTPTPAQGPRSAQDETTPTQGDYTLAAYDWAQFRNGNRGEHYPGPWSYVRLQGLDVAYFGMRLERAVGEKIGEIIARDGHTHHRPRGGSLGATDQPPGIERPRDIRSTNRGKEKSKKDGIAKTQVQQNQQLQIQIHPPLKFRCALGYPAHTNNKPAAVFQPAAALAPGEDWRPPNIIAGLQSAGNSANKGTAKNTMQQQDTATATPMSTTPSSSWAADEVGRREGIKRRAAGQAPEADMEISPTLGRWRRHSLGIGGLAVEDLGANVVEVSGLKFAVDLCACTNTFGGSTGNRDRGLGAEAVPVEGGARVLML